jgi:hypothetical protein
MLHTWLFLACVAAFAVLLVRLARRVTRARAG